MATLSFIFLAFSLLCNLSSLPLLTNAEYEYQCGENCTTLCTNCDGSCTISEDCTGQLICSNGKCNDDPDAGTHICGGSDDDNCQPSGTLTCNEGSYQLYRCSPAVSSSTQAILTRNDFNKGGDGGDESACDNLYHNNSESVVALSTGWFDNRSRCEKMIKITASNGRSTTAKVVDECDSQEGCDSPHAYQKPCRTNIVDASQAVWDALKLDSGEEQVTWSMA